MNGIYIAGPMTGYLAFNYPAFHAAAERLTAAGHPVVVNPAALGDGDTSRPREFYIRQGLSGLLRCDKVALLPEWHLSRGARLEEFVAESLHMDIRPIESWLT